MTPPWYRVAWALARPIAGLAARGDSKLARAVRGRLGGAGALAAWATARRERGRPLVWMHAASVGEGRQAEAVIERLRAARPDWQFVHTFLSPSAERFAATLPVAFAGYIPADTPGDTGRALDAVRPDLLCFSATDVWPELVRQASRRGVQLALVSANLAAASSRLGTVARSALGPAYAAFDRVGAIADADAARLVALGVREDRITVTGDTRHDAAHARASAVDRTAPHLRALAVDGDPRPILVAGSTWPADEARLLAAVRNVLGEGTGLRLVLAPHEPTAAHLAGLAVSLPLALGSGVRVRSLSDLEARLPNGATPSGAQPAGARWDVCLVDRVGVLADLYAAAAFAYVGGGFGRSGLHSVIEPAALGVPMLFGPRWQGSRDARLLLDAAGGRSVSDEATLVAALGHWLNDETARTAAGAAARAVVDRGQGAADRSVGLLLSLLEPPAGQRL
jgi:3-deoxy-D-manno-octulosonic-acid transferase